MFDGHSWADLDYSKCENNEYKRIKKTTSVSHYLTLKKATSKF